MFGPAAPFSRCTEGAGCCSQGGQPNGVEGLWTPPASQTDGPGILSSLVNGGCQCL